MIPDTDVAEALLDWLERDCIHNALLRARPELETAMVLEDGRPLIRIAVPGGRFLVVAKMTEGAVAQWVVGLPGRPEPTIHEPETWESIVRTVLDAWDAPHR